MDIKFLENVLDEGAFNTAREIVHFGWKKEAIPVTHFKKSIIVFLKYYSRKKLLI